MRMKSLIIMMLFAINILYGQNSNKALLLDGDDDFMNTNGTVFGTLNAVTISAWIKSWSAGAILTTHSHGVYWESVELLTQWFIINQSDQMSTRQVLNFPGIADSTWHHIAAVWDGGEMRIYLDGLAYGDSIEAPYLPWNSPASITIGARESFATPLAISEIRGKIDELRVWNVVRSQSQIQAGMHNILGSEYYSSLDSGLIAYWRFDELEDLGVGAEGLNDIRDFSANQLHGDLIGDATIDTSSIVLDIKQYTQQFPQIMKLHQNYPNHFNPSTKIKIDLPKPETVKIEIYNVIGQKIVTLLNKPMPAGYHEVEFDGTNLSSGIYLYWIDAGAWQDMKKMVYIK